MYRDINLLLLVFVCFGTIITYIKLNGVLVVIVMFACDELQKFLLKLAPPPGVESNVITIRKLIEMYHNH